MKNILYRIFLLIATLIYAFDITQAQKKIYFVFGSDTAIWDGMDVAKYSCTYNTALYVEATQNATKVMDASFRTKLLDNRGTPMKLTWWMMGGNIFRYATNTNVPLSNTMTLHLMQKYHSNAIQRWGDELTIHYHTFAWTDYDKDGKYYWNQTNSFEECHDDFDVTLAQYLLEEKTFPVSFRSGWHYMDNGWQNYLNEFLPYSMHNDYPSNRVDTTEPLDNTYNWSRAPSAWVPYRPSTSDYQVPGNGMGWNVRSKHIGGVSSSLVKQMFDSARAGKSQVACLWGHLPETDFLTNLAKCDSIIHSVAKSYPDVEFYYCSAIEAMQRWRGGQDTTAPTISVQQRMMGLVERLEIQTNEPIFQRQPFVAVKDIYGNYRLIASTKIGENLWLTEPLNTIGAVAKLGIAITDTMGNLAKLFQTRVPDEVFVDNVDAGYQELKGVWNTVKDGTYWGSDIRRGFISPGDTAIAVWTHCLNDTLPVRLSIRLPIIASIPPKLFVAINKGYGQCDSIPLSNPRAGEWIYLTAVKPIVNIPLRASLLAVNTGSQVTYVNTDVFRFTPTARTKELAVKEYLIDLGDVVEGDTVQSGVTLVNLGTEAVHILNVSSSQSTVFCDMTLPISITPFNQLRLQVKFSSLALGPCTDTLFVAYDEPGNAVLRIPFRANIKTYFALVDDRDSLSYEEYGKWYFSNAQAYGPTSRYFWFSDGPGAYARWTKTLRKAGYYEVQFIVPTTANAANKALYLINDGNRFVDSMRIDQNANSGSWITLGKYYFDAGSRAVVTVLNKGDNTAGVVLRADAVRWQWIGLTPTPNAQQNNIPQSFALHQNYPNPFNPVTEIKYAVPKADKITLTVYDLLGRKVKTLVDDEVEAGVYKVKWDGKNEFGKNVSSGVYFYSLKSESLVKVRKMMLIK